MSGYIGPIPVPQGIQRKQSFTATAGQTTFNTNGYTDGNFITVYLNGVRLINGTDYTATNGSDVVLASAAAASDVVDFETFNSFSLASQQFENITTKNPTHEDTDGGRESAISFKGEQSGGEISTLAAIQASHDGTSDDQKGDLIFKTNDGSDNDAPTEAARIDSKSNFLIGHSDNTSVADHEAGLQVVGQGTADYHGSTISIIGNANNANGAYLNFGKTRSNTAGTATAASAGDVVGQINFSAADGTDLANRVGFIQAKVNGSVSSNNTPGRFEFYTTSDGSGTPAIRVRMDDHGIKFGSDFAEANGLNDYEEGTWTPNIRYLGSGTDATTSQSSGVYTKIGRVVYCTGMLKVSSTNSGTGHAALSGFPFTVADSVANTSIEGNGVIAYYASFSSNVNTPTVAAVNGTTYAELYSGNAGTTSSAITHSILGANGQIRFSVYFIV